MAKRKFRRSAHHTRLERRNKETVGGVAGFQALIAAIAAGCYFSSWSVGLWTFFGVMVLLSAIVSSKQASHTYSVVNAMVAALLATALGWWLHPVVGLLAGGAVFHAVMVRLKTSIAYVRAESEVLDEDYQ